MRCCARSAPLSKYSHHMMMLPSTALKNAISVGASHVSSANVAPVTSSDSPSAMMTNRAQRSAMWPPSTFQSVTEDRPSPGTQNSVHGPASSMPSASVHHASRTPGSAKPPMIQQVPESVSQTAMRWKLFDSRPGACRTAQSTNSVRPICIDAYAPANTMPRSANECGIDTDRNSPAMVSRNRQTRTGIRSGSSQFVVQAVYIQTHHTAMNSIVTRTTFAHVSSASSVCESCVTANTNTRSKNSSTMPTRPLPARLRSRNNALTGCSRYCAPFTAFPCFKYPLAPMKLSNLMALLALLVVSPAHAQVCPYENLMPEFTEFVAATADLGPQARAEAFVARFADKHRDFYSEQMFGTRDKQLQRAKRLFDPQGAPKFPGARPIALDDVLATGRSITADYAR